MKVGCFGLINPIICSPYLVFHSRVRTEFVIVFIGDPFEMMLLNLRINFWPKRSEEETKKKTNKKTTNNQDEDKKSAMNKKN